MPQGGVRLSGGPVLTDNEASMLESDVSSVIDISDHLAVSDTEDDAQRDELHDLHKYRLPDIGKTRLNLRTKEPLSPARPTPRSPQATNQTSFTPATPQTTHSDATGHFPGNMEFPPNWHVRHSSVDTVSENDHIRPSLSRAGSIYTLGRASFTGQLAQLTSMRLPDAESLAKRISSMPSAADAAKALTDASEQIRMWISKASEVLDGLNSEDDVEWAAAGGREGIEDVDIAISRFQRLVEVYILSIERLQTREDVSQLSAEEIRGSVGQMETIIGSWKRIKDTLKGVKEQVEVAMEWEALWNTALGEIAHEMDGLNQLVFEMEEKRHAGAESVLSSKDSIDLSELETIVEEQPGRGKSFINSRLGIPPFSSDSSTPTPSQIAENKENSSLLALFARMQPLRASLDFLPMRLSVWHVRGNSIFPSACIDLEQRRDQLEAQWNKLESDAESLRRELGEDRWIMVFRNAGRQALKMCESISRSFLKLKDGIDANEQQTNLAAITTKVENYEQKKRHYGPAVERVLAIIDKGVLDRLTVNGEILRLQSDMKHRWAALQSEMNDMDTVLEEINNEKEANLRDSVSTVVSSERSIATSFLDTPGSSPASSIVGGSRKGSFVSRTSTPLTTIKTRSSSSDPRTRLSKGNSLPRKSLLPSSDAARASPKSPASSIPTPSKQPAWPSRPEPDLSNKPRFHNVAAKGSTRDFRPLSAFEPSPYAKTPVTPKANYLRSSSRADGTPGAHTPVPRIVSAPVSGAISSLPRPTTVLGSSRKSPLPVPPVPFITHTTPSKSSRLLTTKSSAPTLRPSSRITSSGRRSSFLPAPPVDGNEADSESPSHHRARPPSALATERRSSMLANYVRSRLDETSLSNPAAVQESRPKWRP